MKYYKVGEIINYKGVDYVTGDSTSQGWVYKDEKAFVKGVGICYIPEYAFEGIGIIVVSKDELGGGECGSTYFELQPIIDKGEAYTQQDLIKVFGDEHKAIIGFDMLDWQFPESLAEELVWEDFE